MTDGWVTVVQPAEDYRPPVPPVYGSTESWDVLWSRLPDRLPATRVVGLPGALAVGHAGWVVTPDRKVVVSLSWYESNGRPSLSSITWDHEEHLPGTVLNLTTIGGANNYGHFLLDGLGRLAVAEGGDLRPADVDWVLLPAYRSPGADRLVAKLRIPEGRAVRQQERVAFTSDLLITPSIAGTARIYRPALPRFLRRLVRPGAKSVGKRLFVSRRGGRRELLNVDAIEGLALAHGFDVIHPWEVDLPSRLAGAGAVISAHGAAMADVGFCRPGAKVIELLPSDHMWPYYFSLAVAGELSYRAVIGASEAARDPGEWGGSPYAFQVDPDAFELALKELDR